jgi:probable rRNA maturation factor
MPAAVSDRQRRVRVSTARLKTTAEVALRALDRADREVHVTVVDDPAIRRLNARWMGSRKSTDVLAFDLAAPGPSRLLGEVVLSADTAQRQARERGVPVALELDLLVVHGLLHLSGYDDHDPSEARLMHERAREILAAAHRRAPRNLWVGLLDGGTGPPMSACAKRSNRATGRLDGKAR